MKGTAGEGPVTGDVDLTPSKVFDDLRLGAMADDRGEAPNGAVTADVVDMALGATGAGDGGRASADWVDPRG